MDIEGTMLSKISQRKTSTIWLHLYVESKEQSKWTNKIETASYIQRTDWELPEGRRIVGALGERGEGTKRHSLVVTK